MISQTFHPCEAHKQSSRCIMCFEKGETADICIFLRNDEADCRGSVSCVAVKVPRNYFDARLLAGLESIMSALEGEVSVRR